MLVTVFVCITSRVWLLQVQCDGQFSREGCLSSAKLTANHHSKGSTVKLIALLERKSGINRGEFARPDRAHQTFLATAGVARVPHQYCLLL
jgi:hypothetical protein